MKRFYSLTMKFCTIFAVISFFMLTACTKEGPTGAAGKDGADGKDGSDGTAVCGTCHNAAEDFNAKVLQYEASKHFNGETSFENAAGCAYCHTSQGYLQSVASSTYFLPAAVSNPAKIGCRTCHNVHKTYTAADWALTNTSPVTFLSAINRPPAPVDYGKANVCARCHQARVATPVDFNAATYKVTSSRFGPHHGVQAQALMGLSAIQFPGVDPYPVGNHKGTQNACVTCHMATAVGDLGGGHTFKVAYEEGGSELFNFAGCLTSGCHTETASQLTTIFKAKQDEIKAKIIILRDKLVAKGWLVKSTTNPDDFLLDMWKATSGAPINATPIEAAVMYNYKTVVEDKSIGIHNPKYVLAVLNASIDKLP